MNVPPCEAKSKPSEVAEICRLPELSCHQSLENLRSLRMVRWPETVITIRIGTLMLFMNRRPAGEGAGPWQRDDVHAKMRAAVKCILRRHGRRIFRQRL